MSKKYAGYSEILHWPLKPATSELKVNLTYISISHEQAIHYTEQKNRRFHHHNEFVFQSTYHCWSCNPVILLCCKPIYIVHSEWSSESFQIEVHGFRKYIWIRNTSCKQFMQCHKNCIDDFSDSWHSLSQYASSNLSKACRKYS